MTTDKVHILVVDDLPENLLVLRTVLGDLGEEIVTARSGQEALRQVLDHDFAVVLLDVNMPGMDGYETAALIRSRRRSKYVPIIFVTSYADEVHEARGYSLGAVDYILSPVVPAVLRTKVKVFVDLFRMTAQVKRQADEQIVLAREQAARCAAEETVRRSNFLAEASKVLANSLEFETTLRGLLRLVVPQLADLGAITLVDEQGRICQTELAWVDPSEGRHASTVAGLKELDGGLVKRLQGVLASGQPEYLPEPGQAMPGARDWHALSFNGADFELKSAAIFPLLARGRALGALTLATARSERRYGPADRALAEDLAGRAAIAIDNARLYRDIQEADRRKNEFMSMLAHELRNPLAPILNGVQFLGLRGPLSPELQQVCDVIQRQVHHLVRLVDDLLDISRITRGKIRLQSRPVVVATVVARALEVSRPLLEARRHELHVSLPAEPLRVQADPVRLAQVLTNLLNNSAKYTEEGGKVWLNVEREGDDVLLKVRDNGMGIPPEMLSSVFDLFTQVERSLDRSQGGLGIGLTLVRRLVEMHGGSVEAHSAGPNQGSEFVVRLPLLGGKGRATTEGDAANAPSSVRPLGSQRILVVDDNRDVAHGLALLLREMGQEVQIAYDGPAALVAAQTFQPQVVLLDIGLPEMDGYQVAWRLRQQGGAERVLLVALTGYGQEDDLRRSQEAGFDHHLVKPARLEELRALLAGWNGRVMSSES